MAWVDIVLKILSVIGNVWMVCYLYKYLFTAVGVFGYRKYAPTEDKRRYGLCIAARNEEKVIENFLRSVALQDYPLENLTVFVVAHNCTDNTAEIVRRFHSEGLPVVVYPYDAPNERTKGLALKYLFGKIAEDYGIESYDGYFIFDADNVIARDYVTRMNEAFVAGNTVVTSFRNSKNVNQNWLSFGYAMHWMRTCLTENRGKSVLKQSCRIQGTGYLFANEFVKNGWNYLDLTEDRCFCSDVVVQNAKVGYCDDAVFFDEQPYKLKVAARQRLRWAKGNLQSTVRYCPKLLKNMFRKGSCFTTTYDCFFLNFPRIIESGFRKFLRWGLKIFAMIYTAQFLGWWKGALIGFLWDELLDWLGKVCVEILVLIVYRKRIAKEPFFKRVFHVLVFPVFDIVGRWATYLAVFKKVEWKPIPHDQVMDLDSLADKNAA